MEEPKVQESSSDEKLRLLFQRLSQGDLQSLEQLYDDFAPKIYGLALWRTGSASDASDVVQEVFVRLADRADRFGLVRHPRRYLLQMARFACADLLRKRKYEPLGEEALVIPASNPPSEEASRLSMLIRELPADQREAIYLRYFVGLSLRETAAATDVTLFTTASRCRLAIGKLRRRLGETK
jgi:RNA polymerase sigma-70 factor (ECF subfamily)